MIYHGSITDGFFSFVLPHFQNHSLKFKGLIEYLEGKDKETNSERLIFCWITQYKIPQVDKLCHVGTLNTNVTSCDQYVINTYLTFTHYSLQCSSHSWFLFFCIFFFMVFVCLFFNIVSWYPKRYIYIFRKRNGKKYYHLFFSETSNWKVIGINF